MSFCPQPEQTPLSAQESDERPQNSTQCDVRWRNAEGVSRDAIQSAAANVSVGSQTIVLYGGSREVWDQIVLGACRQFDASRSKLNGLILADETQTQAPAEIAFYADAQLTATILRAHIPGDKPLSDVVAEQLDNDFQYYFGN